MLSLYRDTCTLYHKDGGEYKRTVLEHVSWQGKLAVKPDGHGIVSADYTAVYIPSEYESILISTGDLLVFGFCPYELPPKTAKELHTDFETVTVKSVAARRWRRSIRHREVIGE